MRFLLLICFACTILNAADEKPLFKNFIGLNGHFHFKPELYKQTCRLARNYHNLNWDVKNVGDPITTPVCQNKVHWKANVYDKWKQHGFETSICLQFSSFNHDLKGYEKVWSKHLDWAYDYGKRNAEYFGPSGNEQLCTSIEIGNEPGRRFDDPTWKKVMKKMAQGIRAGDPKVKIVTATAHARDADDYSKNLQETYSDPEIIKLYDVINVHTYAQIQRKNNSESPWNRSYPEDPSIDYLKVVDETIEWRDKNAPGKEIWITEFGYDCVTPDAMKLRKNWALKLDWQGVSDLMQAQYNVRSLLVFAEKDIDRAYIYFFNDDNKPGVHAGAGLTRNFVPKQSFWAVKQCYEVLGDYRFKQIIEQKDDAWVFAFSHATDKNREVWVAWSPTGTQSHKKDGYVGKTADITLSNLPGTVSAVQGMATKKDKIPAVKFKKPDNKSISLTVTESPCYIIME